MKLNLYQVDAFASRLFKGNPAAVIPLAAWIPDKLMQQLAMENNLAETVFFVPEGDEYHIRWFTPEAEINLCGHATLASAFILFYKLGYNKPVIRFNSLSGPLEVRDENGLLWMDFPSWKPERTDDYPPEIIKALGNPEYLGVYKHRDYIVELADEKTVKKLEPDFSLLKKTGVKLIITAQGQKVDFVSRFFAPSVGVNEDPVTGSAHSQLIPFWAEKLGKTEMEARQLSKRGGELFCVANGDRVKIGGRCVFYMKGEIDC